MSPKLDSLRKPLNRDRRGIALIMVMMVVSSLLIIGVLFSGTVTAEYRAAVYYRQAIQSEQYCIVGLHRAMAELMYDVWGVYEDRPFITARYNVAGFVATDPETNLLPLSDCSPVNDDGSRGDGKPDAAYYDTELNGALKPITRQRGFWNGEAWVVWAGASALTGHADKVPRNGTDGGNVWNMDPRPFTRPEMIGGAQKYISYGDANSAGTVSVTNGSNAVSGTGTAFDKSWIASPWDGHKIEIDGVEYEVGTVTDATTLTLRSDYGGTSGAGKSYWCSAMTSAPPSKDPGLLSGGTQAITTFTAAPSKGYAANPRWVNPAHSVAYRSGGALLYGGVDIDADGTVDAKDKALRDWALWQLRRDAFLPEAMDNHDLFEAGLHANNRKHWDNKFDADFDGTDDTDHGWEFIDPKIVGDAYYLVFRSDPLYSVHANASGNYEPDPVSGLDTNDSYDDPAWSPGSPGALDAKSDQAGYRYPYDRGHLGKSAGVEWANDPTGGLANINQCNNNYNFEQWTSIPSGSPSDCLWYHYNEAKWIYVYDPLDAEKRYGRYAVTIVPDCGTWNISGLQGGKMHPYVPEQSNAPYVRPGGFVKAASGYFQAIQGGFHPQTGDSRSASFLQSVACAYAPIRPDPLPHYWANIGTGNEANYFCPAGYTRADADSPDSDPPSIFPCTDYTRAPEILAGHGGTAWDTNGTGVRASILNYMSWLGPFDSRAELATYLRKACLQIPEPAYDPYPDHQGKTAALRRCMEDEMTTTESNRQKTASDAMMITALTTVQGYYHTLDRFWERDMLVVDWLAGDSGSATDARFATSQCTADAPVNFATAAAKPGQVTRRCYIQMMRDLQCFGGYRTRDGDCKLLQYLFDADHAAYNPDAAPASLSPAYGGGGSIDNPAGWTNQKKTSRMEKFVAMTTSRMASMQRGSGARSAACSRGHLVHNPVLSSAFKSEWGAGTKTISTLRTSAAENTVDEIGEGCPVCGGKLFLNAVHESHISEIGRFYEKFKNAERPVREAFDLDDPAKKPARNFVELMTYGYISGSSDKPGSKEKMVRFDQLIFAADDSATRSDIPTPTVGKYTSYPGVLCDPMTRAPYFTTTFDFDLRHRMPYSDAAEAQDMNPEPVFNVLIYSGSGCQYDWRLLVWDETDGGGRWHDVTHCVDYGMGSHYYSSWPNDGQWYSLADGPLYNKSRIMIADDSDPDSTTWDADRTDANRDNWTETASALFVRADERYVMEDPDPAHQQAADENNFPTDKAWVTIYRKMPVRWYGGQPHYTYNLEYEDSETSPEPLGGWDALFSDATAAANARPRHRVYGRGLGFGDTYRRSGEMKTCFHYQGDGDWRYKGDADWPKATKVKSAGPPVENYSTDELSGLIVHDERSGYPESIGQNCLNPRQYAVITFDGSFDGSKIALMTNYNGAYVERPDYQSYRIVDYVELTDSAGAPVRISQACGDPTGVEGSTVLSWQARHPVDNRGNADGYMCWDLLPITLQNATIDGTTAGRAPASDTLGYDPWSSDPDYKWWGNASDAHFLNFDRTAAQTIPPGYANLWAVPPECNLRNSNMYFRDTPMRRRYFDGARPTSFSSHDARCEQSTARTDHATREPMRNPDRKECTMSIPTGIGRQVEAAAASNAGPNTPDTWPATYSGRQHSKVAGSWVEGSGTSTASHNWAAYSWDNWSDIYKVTDLCGQMLWHQALETPTNVYQKEHQDYFDGDQDGERDELSTAGLAYTWDNAGTDTTVSATGGHFVGELKQVNKLNLNELWYPPTFGGTGWHTQWYGNKSSYTSFGRKPLKGFHSPADAMTYHFAAYEYDEPLYHSRVKPWDLDGDYSTDFFAKIPSSAATSWCPEPAKHFERFDSVHCSNSTVHTIYVTGNAIDAQGDPVAEMRARVTVERTWDGRANILEFTWMPTDRGFME